MPELTDLIEAILVRGSASSVALQREFGVSQPTLSRAISALGERIVRIGAARSTRYALRREIPQIGSAWPVFIINDAGEPSPRGTLNALARDQYWFAATPDEYSELSDGLPYFLQDLWPQGFIGRTVPRRFRELGLPERLADWNETHVLAYLTLRGDDTVGNLLIGDESLQRYLRQFQGKLPSVDAAARLQEYPRLAEAAIAGAPVGSSAGGEHPKFAVPVRSGKLIRNVLVKFSPARTERIGQRWSDLLVAEYVADRALQDFGIASCAAEVLVAGKRTFLESNRFDRVGERGRVGIISLAAVADHLIGSRDNWIAAAASLEAGGHISAQDAQVVRRVATFGQLIGNTDMHFGNLSFYFSFGRPLALAPVYDMLPMMYAPIAGDELPEREFEPPLPVAGNLDIWKSVAEAAVAYWRQVASHDLVSKEFAVLARKNARAIAQVMAHPLIP